MNKILFLSIGGVVIVGLVILAFRLTEITTQTPVQTPSPSSGQGSGSSVFNSAGQYTPADPLKEKTISIATAGGGTIQTKDFIGNPATVKDPVNPGYYYLGYHVYEGFPDPQASDNPPYIIGYIAETHYFNIALLQEPIGSVREDAQQYLMTHLGLSQEVVCQLNYMVSVSSNVNAVYSGKNLGFSFCPGATLLPK